MHEIKNMLKHIENDYGKLWNKITVSEKKVIVGNFLISHVKAEEAIAKIRAKTAK